MRASDEDALMCDFAQYYGIYSFEDLPVRRQAVLALGLPRESRIMRKLSGVDQDEKTLFLAGILDELRVMNWRHTKEAKHKRNYPKSILNELLHGKEKEKEQVKSFSSGEDFLAHWESINRSGTNG